MIVHCWRQTSLHWLRSSIMPRVTAATGNKTLQSKTKKNNLKLDEEDTKLNVKTEPVEAYFDEEKKSITLDLSKFKFDKKPHIKIEFENDSPVKETKVKYIKKTTQTLKEQYNSDIPDSVEKLCKLTGVGPKMAHICMSVAWNKVTGIGQLLWNL
ncbi:hypothetical protein MSG28_004317 [Choristoneura fumiferana]|uniref:Uncharacterized protein n=1 Tax=Choristoneura fumiferana TaxID=7141 RepID=A0ACC0KI96_CHOFU|nr:hypothetical protein MSG28_004317 [Choristoneura fumiferana]